MKRSAQPSTGRSTKKRRFEPTAARRKLQLQGLSEETLLQTLSELDYADLLAASETSRHLYRLANDEQLWKLLYNRHFLGGRRRRTAFKAFERPIKPLRNGKTWRELFRVAHNWSTGNARTTQLSLRAAVLPRAPSETTIEDETTPAMRSPVASTIDSYPPGHEKPSSSMLRPAGHARSATGIPARIAWHGQYYFVTSQNACSGSPSIAIFSSGQETALDCIYSTGLRETAGSQSIAISEIVLDDQPYCASEGLRLAAFYTNGQYSIFRLRNIHAAAQGPISWQEEYFSAQRSSKAVVTAKFHTPLLVTSSRDCSVRFRLLEERTTSAGDNELHISLSQPTMRTHMCYAPLAMKLEAVGPRIEGKQIRDLRLSLAYSTPYYPAAQTVGIQVFDIHVPSSFPAGEQSKLHVLARSAIAVPPVSASSTLSSQPVSEDEQGNDAMSASPMEAVVTSLQHDGPYVVTSKSDNTISVYRVSGLEAGQGLQSFVGDESESSAPPSPVKMQACALKIEHVRTLFGHTSAVDAISIADGRCVSAGKDGLKVWELPPALPGLGGLASSRRDVDRAWPSNVSVFDPAHSASYETAARRSWLGLDASKIVALCEGQGEQEGTLKVYDFE